NATMMMLSSRTRFVEAISNAIAAVKFAPLRKIERASATAAYEHDDEAAPSASAVPIGRGRSSGSSWPICCFETTACTGAERAKPSQPAAVFAAVTDKPFGRPQQAAVLDGHCARQPRQCAGRDGRIAPRGAELKNATKPEDNMT